MEHSSRWSLCIDPQNIGTSFIKKYAVDHMGENFFKVLKATSSTIASEVEMALKFGRWLLVENLSETLNPELEGLLLLQKKKVTENKVTSVGVEM